jgi:hypothetical protein
MHTTTAPMTELVRTEWRRFRSPGRVIAMTAASLVVIALGLLFAAANRSSCSRGPVEVACPSDPRGPQDQAVTDNFSFVHQPLDRDGSITARMTSMTGIITYPPPDHDEIVSGLVPWAKAGVIIKDGLEQGSAYAALMITGEHGVRMQHNYVHDVAGNPGRVSARSPRWLRLTRSGDTITGYESADGEQWIRVGTARLAGLPATVQVGLFATSPGAMTLRQVALGAGLPEVRFTQATAVFDDVSVVGGTGEWSDGSVGEMGHTDWERYHRAPGVVESNGAFAVTGSGDIGPIGAEGGHPVERPLVGLAIGLLPMLVVAVRFVTGELRTGAPAHRPLAGRVLAAKALVIGGAALISGLVAAGVVVPVSAGILRANGTSVVPASTVTGLRVVVGVAALLAVAAIFALALGALLRRTWAALLVAISTVLVPYLLAALPLLPDDAARWLLRVTPAAGFAVQQTIREYPQVVAHYAPSSGYFPLPWWAGFALLCGYAAVAFALAVARSREATV